jgi:hypothetical protein
MGRDEKNSSRMVVVRCRCWVMPGMLRCGHSSGLLPSESDGHRQ